MNRKKTIIAAVSLVFVVIAALIIHRCSLESGKSVYDATLYFYNETETTIEGVQKRIRYTDMKNLAEEIVLSLMKDPDRGAHHKILNSDTRLLAVTGIESGALVVSFSPEFMTGSEKNYIFSVYSVVKSLCAVDGINSVKVVVDGRDIYSCDGAVIGFLTDQDINLSTDAYNSEMREVTLYFPLRSGEGLGREVRSIRVTDQQPLAQYIINELIKGPRGDFANALDSGTELNSVEISNNICFVNFKSSFADKNTGSANSEKLTIFSIVDSLTEFEYIDRVQFFIDGRRVDEFGNINIFGMFGRDESLISE